MKDFHRQNLCMVQNLYMRRKHNYYFQCQGQMNVLGMPWIDFVVRRTNPNQLHVEGILCDHSLWVNTMVPKRTAFYFKAVLPELAVPHTGLSPGIREPEKPWVRATKVYIEAMCITNSTITVT